mmetsp:Transcript_60012/g.106807  ORF Transcript_60012/g.106807 Transcript_60012/m.106807 type:complete len:219 (-) Transcript_60012:117-773(-)
MTLSSLHSILLLLRIVEQCFLHELLSLNEVSVPHGCLFSHLRFHCPHSFVCLRPDFSHPAVLTCASFSDLLVSTVPNPLSILLRFPCASHGCSKRLGMSSLGIFELHETLLPCLLQHCSLPFQLFFMLYPLLCQELLQDHDLVLELCRGLHRRPVMIMHLPHCSKLSLVSSAHCVIALGLKLLHRKCPMLDHFIHLGLLLSLSLVLSLSFCLGSVHGV